jgi:hypothetical protein
MFSLIITIISIALVTALAVATLYYGGNSFTQAGSSAQASTVINQAQQLMGAMEMFRIQQGRWPNSLAELSPQYLRTLPSLQAAADPQMVVGAVAQQVPATWEMPAPGVPTIELSTSVTVSLCREVNTKTRGDDGILRQAHVTLAAQCYGASEENLKVVVTKNGESLLGALPSEDVTTAPLPPPTEEGPWLVSPGEAKRPGGSGGPSAPEPSALRVYFDQGEVPSGESLGTFVYGPNSVGSSWLVVVSNDGDEPIPLTASSFAISGFNWTLGYGYAFENGCSQILSGSRVLEASNYCTIRVNLPALYTNVGASEFPGTLTVEGAVLNFSVDAVYQE